MHALVIGASKESIFAIRQAQKLGMRVIAFDGDKNAEGLKYADESIVVDIREPENIYKEIDKKNINNSDMVVIPVPIGRYLTTTGAVNDHYHLIGVRKKTAEICTDKFLFHRTLNKLGLRDIRCCLVSAGEEVEKPSQYPVIVKPRYGAGSRSVIQISNEDEWNEIWRTFPMNEDFIIEDVVCGNEYGIDGIVINGQFQLILIRKKINTKPPYRQCVGYISVNNTSQNQSLINRITHFMCQLVDAIGLENGLLHADIIDDGKEPFVIEMSARPSGHYLHDVFTPMATGVNMVAEFLQLASSLEASQISIKNDEVYMIRFFDIETIKNIPDKEFLFDKYPIKKYVCNLEVGNTKKVVDGHSLMNRGYFIINGCNEKQVVAIADNILKEFQ